MTIRVLRPARPASLAVILTCCGVLATAPTAGAASVPPAKALYEDGPSGRYLLGGDWYRRADPNDRGQRLGFPTSTDLSGWTRTTVPNAANAGDFSTRSYLGGVWWYRKDFQAPATSGATTWLVRFESVNYRATVWLNGRRIGQHAGAYLPFELEAKNLRARGTNHLVVRVDSRRRALDIPQLAVRPDGRYVGGWWNYAGILREVYLRRVSTFDFSNVLVRPNLPCRACSATIDVRAVVGNLGANAAPATVKATVGGKPVELGTASIPTGGFHLFSTSVRVTDPKLWSPDAPNLYLVKLQVQRGGHTMERYTVHTGIRSFKVDRNGRLLLNGRPIRLHGANMHEDDPVRGAALQSDDIRANIALLRDLGANMTRSHYPLHPLTLELADRYGIIVWDELPVYQMSDALFRNPAVRRQATGMLRGMIDRDRNHPSVVVWSLGNENTTKPAQGFTAYVHEAIRLAKQLDPTRLVALAIQGYPTVARQPLYAQLDALGVNDYFGWYPGPQNSIANRNDLGPYLDRLHGDYPRQALFVTEFGAEANRSGLVSEKGTYQFQSDFLRFHLNVIASKRFIGGALVWILRDFRVKPGYDGGNPNPQPPENFKGLVDDAGQHKPAFDIVRQAFSGPRNGPQ